MGLRPRGPQRGRLFGPSRRFHHPPPPVGGRSPPLDPHPHRPHAGTRSPAKAGEGNTVGDPLGRKPGEALWPERFDREALLRIREVLMREHGERSWLALYQQRPTSREGAFFKVSQIQIEPCAPANMRSVVRAWDMAATAGGGAYTAGVKMGVDKDGVYWVLDVVRGQWSTDERDRVIVQTAALDGKAVKIRGPQDPGAAGKGAAEAFVRMLAGFTVVVKPVSGSKELRADPYSSQLNAGNVKLVAGDWNRAFIEEHRLFPRGAAMDQVDAASDAFAELSATPAGWAFDEECLRKMREFMMEPVSPFGPWG